MPSTTLQPTRRRSALPLSARLRGILALLLPQNIGKRALQSFFPIRSEPPQRTTRDFLLAYNTMPWLRAVVHRVAGAVAAVTWRVYATRDRQRRYYQDLDLQSAPPETRWKMLKAGMTAATIEELTDHSLARLLRQGNTVLTGINTRRLLQMHLDLVGEGHWVLGRNAHGMPTSIWPMPPSWVIEIPTPSTPFYRVEHEGWSGAIPETEVLSFYDPNPENPYSRGRGMAMALADELETDEYAARHVKSWFYNRARPDILITAQGLSPEDTERLEREWVSRFQGFMRAFKPFFMNRQVDVKEIGQSFESMQFSKLRESERDIVVNVFGVPPEILGILENSNRATIDASEAHFARYVQIPRLEYLREVLQQTLVPQFDERLILDYDSPSVDDKEFTLNVVRAAPWAFQLDDYRTMAGLEPLPNGAGQSMGLPLNIQIVPTSTLAQPPQSPVVPANLAATPMVSLHAKVASRGCQGPAMPTLEVPSQGMTKDNTIALHRLADRLRPTLRRQFLAVIEYLRGQAVLDDLEVAAARGATNAVVAVIPWETLPDAFTPIKATLRSALQASGELAARDLSTTLQIDLRFDLSSPTAVEAAEQQAAALISGVTETTRQAIRQLVMRQLADGVDPRALAREIQATIGLTPQQEAAVARLQTRLAEQGVSEADSGRQVARYREVLLERRAEVIAQHELMTAANAGHQEAWNQAVAAGNLNPTQWYKIWTVTDDDKLCPICAAVPKADANQQVPVAGAFTTSDGQLLAYPPAHVGCRCVVSIRLKIP